MLDYCFLCFFNRNRGDFLKIENTSRFFSLYVMEEGMNGSKSLVSGRDAALSVDFQPLQKVSNQFA